ncbi:response regulator transcription factor [Nitrospirillum sp. BR 11163]|uniref:response regulator transcription factor n=1 Tax=Nitrospirillum sp. BR 11163 TaxID=3104323 RepID=UPI002AFF342B|nr:response regulator transcription factor [Nitrospirillum sp. BR 11163]MEA1673061.1 response regulator transcription factor [Nitrospirillum sp. BR 11163]
MHFRPSARLRPDQLIVVEDDEVTRLAIVTYFSANGFEVREAGGLAECMAHLRRRPTDLIFLDVRLPDGSGMELAREIRATSQAGIIFVTELNDTIDRIIAFELGGDDFVSKPVDLRELLARAHALLRRLRASADLARQTVTQFGTWLLDLTRRELLDGDGRPLHLTRGEFDLLAALVEADGRPLSRDYLAEVVSNRGSGEVNPRTVDTLIARLRHKLVTPQSSPSLPAIITVSGMGYRLGTCQPQPKRAPGHPPRGT